MAVTYVDQATTQASAAINLTVNATKPAGVAAGDLMVAHFALNGRADNGDTPPSGWTKFVNFTNSAAGVVDLAYWKIAGSSEPSTYAFNHHGGSDLSPGNVAIVAYRGADPTTPITDVGSANPTVGPNSDYETTITTTGGRELRTTIHNADGTGWSILVHPFIVHAVVGPPRMLMLATRFELSGDAFNAADGSLERLTYVGSPVSWVFEGADAVVRSYVRGGQMPNGTVRGGQTSRGDIRAGQQPR